MTYRYKCRQPKPDAEVIAGVCIGCRAEANEDERPVTAIVSGVMFPQPRARQKKLTRTEIVVE